MSKKIILSILGIIVIVTLEFWLFRTERAQPVFGQVGRSSQLTTYSASSTFIGQILNGETVSSGSACTVSYCPSLYGTREVAASATSTGGTFLDSTNGTTSVLALETQGTDQIAFDLLFHGTSTGVALPTLHLSIDYSNDGIDWYPSMLPLGAVSTPNAPTIPRTTFVTIGGTPSSTPYLWNITAVNSYNLARFEVMDVNAKYARISAGLSGVGGVAATGTLRVQATQKIPF